MEARDAYYFMLLAQEYVQQYINMSGIGADHAGAFEVTYNQHFVTRPQPVLPIVSQFRYNPLPGQVLATLPVHAKDTLDFSAVVKISITRNFGETILVFSARFTTRFGLAVATDDSD